jgi:hypothetical protein
MHTCDRNTLPAPAAFTIHRHNEALRSRIPLWVCAVALVIAALHMFPYWHAQLSTLPGWHFTGNLSSWPDEVQYRVWLRQAPNAGLFVDDRFTSEPSRPFLPVALYYVIGWASHVLSIGPDMTFAYAGALFAAALTIMIYAMGRQFLSTRAAAWTLIVVVFGGGLGAYFKFIELLLWQFKFGRAGAARINQFLQTARVFEDYRENYVIRAIFDSHFAFFWTLILAALLALYWTLRMFSVRKLMLSCALCMVITLLHVYDGVLLIAIAAGITTLTWMKKLPTRPALISLAALTASICTALGGLFVAQLYSGLPFPQWQSPNVSALVLFMAYPVAALIITPAIPNLWSCADFDRCFLMGWTLGAIGLTALQPLYPYAGRASITVQVPLYTLAAMIYFSGRAQVPRKHVLTAVVLLGITPVWVVLEMWRISRFQPDSPAVFVNQQHLAISETLRKRASTDDILLAAEPDTRWLAPDYPGRHYCAHYFLTVAYLGKTGEVNRFFEYVSPKLQAQFLSERRVRFLYVDRKLDPERFANVPGLTLVRRESVGSLFEYRPAQSASASGRVTVARR